MVYRNKCAVSILGVVIAIALVLPWLLTGCASQTTPSPSPAPTPAATQKFNFKACDYIESNTHYAIGMRYFIDNVKKRTNGNIDIQYFGMASLVGSRELLEATAKGVTDFGFISVMYYPGELPFMGDAQTIPMAYTWDTFDAVMAYEQPFFNAELKPQNQFGFFPQPSSAVFATRKPWDNLMTPNLKGWKLRTPGGSAKRMAELLGAAVVSTPSNEIPSALSTGVIEGFWNSMTSTRNLGLYEMAPFIVDHSPSNGPGNISTGIQWTMNLDSYNKLPADYQKIILEEGQKASKFSIQTLLTQVNDDVAFVKSKGCTVHQLTKEERASWTKIFAPIEQEYIKKHGQKMVDFIAQIRKITGS